MTKYTVYRSLIYFLLAGICEIGGGYLVWQAIRCHRPLWLGVFGGILLAMYGVIATLQPADFGRTFAAYGGLFVFLSILWGWHVDKIKPDVFDWVGSAFVLAGAIIIFYAPRK